MSFERFGIIRTLPDGIPQWIEVVEGFAEARARVMRLASKEPGEFFLYSEKSGVIVEQFTCVDPDTQYAESEETETRPLPGLLKAFSYRTQYLC